MQSLRQDGARGSILVPLLRLPVAILPKPGNDGGAKKIHTLFCRHHRALHHPDPAVRDDRSRPGADDAGGLYKLLLFRIRPFQKTGKRTKHAFPFGDGTPFYPSL